MINILEVARTRLLYRSNRRLSRQAFEQRRLERFRKFAAFVKANSPYYRRIMEERGIDPKSCVPEQFPPLTKDDVIRNFEDIITIRDLTYKDVAEFVSSPSPHETLLRNRYVVVHSSGSSGEVGFFLYDPKDWAHVVAALSRAKGFSLLSSKRKKIAFMGATQGNFAGVTSANAVRRFPLNLFYELRVFEINRPLREAVAGMNAYQPDIVVGYCSALKLLAEKQIEGELRIKPEVVTNSGEPIPAFEKRLIEQAFGKCVRNFYTCSEHMFMGLKEAWQDSMYLFEDELIFEIHSDHTLVTNIFNRTLPLIRYRMTDILRPVDQIGHPPYQAIAEIAGRVESVAKFRNVHGEMDGISPHTMNEVLIPHVRQFQVRLRSPESFDFAIVLKAGTTNEQRHEALHTARVALSAILSEKEMTNVSFDVPIVDEIPVDPKTGKFRPLVMLYSTKATTAGTRA